jgi:hypothetical protein
VLEVQAGLTSLTNEVVVLVMVGGAGSTAARGLGRPADSSSWPGGMTSTDPRQPSLDWSDVRPHASNRFLVTVVIQGAWDWRRVELRRGESGEGKRGDWRRWWGECGCCGSV